MENLLMTLLVTLGFTICFAASNVTAEDNTDEMVINVKNFGAKGDGKADDSIPIQNAFDYACETDSSPRSVVFPPGKYRVTKTLRLDNRHRNISIKGTGGPRGTKYATTKILFDGDKGQPLLECKPLNGLVLTDILLDGLGKAGVLLRINSTKGHGTAEFFLKRVNFFNADIGIECGADLDICASDMTFIDIVIENMTTAGFKAVSNQALDFVFIRSEVNNTPIAFHFIKGGAATFIHPCAFKVDTMLKIERSGINSGAFSIRGWFWERYSYSSKKKKMVFVDAAGEANITVTGTSTGCTRVWGKDADLKTPNFILGPSAQLTVIGCMISGKIATLTGKKDRPATFAQFINCRFRCASNPLKDIEVDDYSGYEFQNSNVTIDDTTGEKYKVHKIIFIPRLTKYPKQAEEFEKNILPLHMNSVKNGDSK
jgi:hypothetical protein